MTSTNGWYIHSGTVGTATTNGIPTTIYNLFKNSLSRKKIFATANNTVYWRVGTYGRYQLSDGTYAYEYRFGDGGFDTLGHSITIPLKFEGNVTKLRH